MARMARPLSMALLGALVLVAPRGARAQTLDARVLSVTGHTTVTDTTRFGVADCTASVAVRITGGVAGTTGVWDFWEGVACNDPLNRTSTSGTAACTHGHSETITSATDQTVTLPLIDLFPVLAGACSGSDSNPVWVLAAPAAGSTAEVTQYDSLTLILDFTAPTAPTGLGDSSGDPPSLTWTGPSGATDIDHYCVYIDATVTADTCGTSTMFAGDGGTAVACLSTGSAAASYDLASGIAAGGQASVAVAAVDTAGNVGPISNIACARRVPTDGFWDRYQAAGGTASTCAASPSARAGAWPALLALGVAVALGRVVRRRRPR